MKRLLSFVVLSTLLFSLNAVEVSSRANGAYLKLSAPKDAIYIDIYINNRFVERLDALATEYTLSGLSPNSNYNLSIAYREADNSDISAEFESFRTTSWDGVYLWENRTNRDNNGRAKEIRFIVKSVSDPQYGSYNEVYMRTEEGEDLRLFPIIKLGEATSWIDYDGPSPEARAYRENASVFNKSPINPSSWRLTKMEVSPTRSVSYIDTRAFGFTIECVISFEFFIDSDGNNAIAFKVSGPSILNSFYFSCPDEESKEGEFILKKVEN